MVFLTAGTTFWQFMIVLIIILAIFLGVCLVVTVVTNPKFIIGCVIVIIVIIVCIYSGIKGVTKFVRKY